MTDKVTGMPAGGLYDDDLRREVEQLHRTRHETMLHGSEDALQNHTARMLELEQEFIRRFPLEAAPDGRRTRAGSRAEAGQDS